MDGNSGSMLTAIDLFSGAGGLSLGLVRAGFTVVAAADLDGLAVETYRLNHPAAEVCCADVRSLDPTAVLSRLGLAPGQLDLLAGCPPCQGFSTLRTLNGRRTCTDPRNDLVMDFLRFVEAIEPRAVLLENVPALADDPRLATVRSVLEERGYAMKGAVLDAQDHGVPQRRRRFVLIASRVGRLDMTSVATQPQTVRSAIGTLTPPGTGCDPLHDYRETRQPRIADLIRSIPRDGGNRRQAAEGSRLACHVRCDGFYDVYGRMAWDRPAPTITTGCINPSKGRFLHPDQDRAITLREAALLQGFPPDYQFSLGKGRYRAAELIGNAFPPPFAWVHARAIMSALRAAS